METTLIVVLAGSAVFLPAMAGFGRSWTYAMIGFACIVLGGVMLIATPTPGAYDPALASTRPFFSSHVGQSLSGGLLLGGVFALLTAYMVSGRPSAAGDADADEA